MTGAAGMLAVVAGAALAVTTLHTYAAIIGPSVSWAFLYLIAVLNLVVLVSSVKVFRQMRHGLYSDQELERQLDSRGLMNRVFGGCASRIDAP